MTQELYFAAFLPEGTAPTTTMLGVFPILDAARLLCSSHCLRRAGWMIDPQDWEHSTELGSPQWSVRVAGTGLYLVTEHRPPTLEPVFAEPQIDAEPRTPVHRGTEAGT